MNVSDVPPRIRQSRSTWLAVALVFFSILPASIAFARPDLSRPATKEVERPTRPIAFAVTQPALATQPAEMPASQPASQPTSMPASQPTSMPASAPSTQPRDPDLTPEMIEMYKKRAQGTEDLPDAEKKAILGIYDQALTQMKLVDDWTAQIARYDEQIKRIPAQLEQAKAKWAQDVEDLTPRAPDSATLGQVERLCSEAEDLDRAARIEAGGLRREQQACQDHRQTNVARQNQISQLQDQYSQDLKALEAGTSEAEQARRALLRVKRRALYREKRTLDKQSAYDNARGELLTVQTDVAQRYQGATTTALGQWKEILKQHQTAQAARTAAQASQQSVVFRDRPELFDIAEQNKALAEKRVQLQTLASQIQQGMQSGDNQIQQAMQSIDDLRQLRRTISENSSSMMQRIQSAGLTEAVSSLLRRHRMQLPDVLQHERTRRRLETEIAKAQFELIDLEDQRSGLIYIDRQTNQILAGLKKSITEQDRPSVRSQLQDLLRTQRKYLDDLILDYNSYTKIWLEIAEEERQLIAETHRYADYIDEHILWVRSCKPLQPVHIGSTWHALRWLACPAAWREVGQGAWTDLQTNPLTLLWGVLMFAGLMVSRRRLRVRLRAIDEIASKSYSYAFTHTLEAIGLTLLLAVAGPGLVWFAGWRLSTVPSTSEFVGALAAGLRSAGVLYLVLETVRQVCRPKGLGQTHLLWPADAMQLLRKNLVWLMPLTVLLTLLISTIEWQAAADHKDSLGRLAFIAGLLALAVFARRVMRPGGPLMAGFLERHASGWLDRLRYIWYPASVAIPPALALAAATGYYYTAMALTSRLLATVALVFASLVLRALLLRLLFVARRKLAIEEAHKRQASQQARAAIEGIEAGAADAKPNPGPVVAKEAAVDLATADAQTRRLVRVGILFALGIGLYVTWADMLPALGVLDRVQLWSTTMDTTQVVTSSDGSKIAQTVPKIVPITLGSIAWAGLIILMSVIAARNIPGLLELTVLRLMPLEPGGRYAINALSRYLITIIGLIMAFGAIGIGWSKVQWLAAAITVGLGFGLQEIFANFISGIIILFERPIRVGDVVTVGAISGTVSKIRIRAATIVDWDRKELIVPNKEFITSQLINWTLSDPILRVVVPVGVAYGSDTCAVQNLLLKIARANPHVLEHPQPEAFFLGFGDSSLDFSLRAFVPSPDVASTVQHEIHMAIDKAFREAGIEIAFPQRDVNVRLMDLKALLPMLGTRQTLP